jgi:hypothetical protein
VTERVESVEAECEKCGTAHYVFPPTMGQVKDPAGEVPKVDLGGRVASDARLVTADPEGRWSCQNPDCRHLNQTPALKLT